MATLMLLWEGKHKGGENRLPFIMLFNCKPLFHFSASTNSDELHEKLRFYQNATGTVNDIINSISKSFNFFHPSALLCSTLFK